MATILIVDDYAPQHRLLSFVLEQHGHAVVSAFDGEQALERLLTNTIDLIVTDLTMPGMGGLELAEVLRHDRRYANIPIIILTASAKEQDYAEAQGAGVACCLTKPIDSSELVEAISQLAQKKNNPKDSWPFLSYKLA